MKFKLGQIVFLVTDIEQREHIITGVMLSLLGYSYRLACGSNEYWAYAEEISSEKRII